MAERPNNTGVNKTRALQHTLYWAAKRSPKRRFHELFDRVYRRCQRQLKSDQLTAIEK